VYGWPQSLDHETGKTKGIQTDAVRVESEARAVYNAIEFRRPRTDTVSPEKNKGRIGRHGPARLT